MKKVVVTLGRRYVWWKFQHVPTRQLRILIGDAHQRCGQSIWDGYEFGWRLPIGQASIVIFHFCQTVGVQNVSIRLKDDFTGKYGASQLALF